MQPTKHNIPGGIFLAFLIFQLTMSTFVIPQDMKTKII